VVLQRSKANQEFAIEERNGVPARASAPRYCRVALVRQWLSSSGLRSGPLLPLCLAKRRLGRSAPALQRHRPYREGGDAVYRSGPEIGFAAQPVNWLRHLALSRGRASRPHPRAVGTQGICRRSSTISVRSSARRPVRWPRRDGCGKRWAHRGCLVAGLAWSALARSGKPDHGGRWRRSHAQEIA
jgi:hypothetical protein